MPVLAETASNSGPNVLVILLVIAALLVLGAGAFLL